MIRGRLGSPRDVLIVQPHSEWGGPGFLLKLMLEHLDADRYRPWVALPRDSENAGQMSSLQGRVLRCRGLRSIPRTMRPDRMAAYLRQTVRLAADLARWSLRHGIALIHSWTESVWAGGLAARFAGLPALSSSIGSTNFHPPAVGWGLSQILRVLSDRILACQETNRRIYRSFGIPGNHLRIVYNCTDTVAFSPPEPRSGREPPALGMIAGPARIKGHQDLLDALGLLRARGLRFRAYLIGSMARNPAYFNELHKQVARLGIEQSVVFTGFVEDVRAYLSELDLFVLPSRFEALSEACLEAMAMCLPVVATSVGGNPEAVLDGVTGRIVPPQNPTAMAAAIEELLGDEELRCRMGQAGRERVVARFDVRSSVAALMDAYDELLVSGSV